MSATEPTARRRNRNWIWVFAALAVLGGLAIAVNWTYNAAQPLTDDQLRAARALWKKNRPTDYDLKIYVIKEGPDRAVRDQIALQVRDRQVVSFLLNGKEPEPLLDREGRRNVDEERRQREHFDIDGIFSDIEQFMAIDRREGGRSFLRARFDKQDGHVILFIRQVNKKRVPHIQVELKRAH